MRSNYMLESSNPTVTNLSHSVAPNSLWIIGLPHLVRCPGEPPPHFQEIQNRRHSPSFPSSLKLLGNL